MCWIDADDICQQYRNSSNRYTMSSNDDLYGELDVEEEDQTIGGPSLNSLSGGEVVEDSNKISQIVNNGAESRLSSENWELSSNDRCFIVKPDSYAEIESSFRDGELQPPQWVRDRLLSACKNGGVFLVFSVNNSRAFQGYAEVDPKTAQMTDTEGVSAFIVCAIKTKTYIIFSMTA